MVRKQCYIHSSLDVVFCLPLHIHDSVENVLRNILFYVHEVKVMVEEISLPIRKLLENTLFYPIVGQTKSRKLLLTRMKTKHNVTVLWYNVMQFFTKKTQRCNILFNSANKEIVYVLSISMIRWQKMTVVVKKKALPLFVSVNALLFSMQYGHSSFPCVLQP